MNQIFVMYFYALLLLVAVNSASATLRGAGIGPPLVEESTTEQQNALYSSVAMKEFEDRETLESPRIIGGSTASQGQYPYYGKIVNHHFAYQRAQKCFINFSSLAIIACLIDKVQWAGCGGTLIHEDVVLTAGI